MQRRVQRIVKHATLPLSIQFAAIPSANGLRLTLNDTVLSGVRHSPHKISSNLQVMQADVAQHVRPTKAIEKVVHGIRVTRELAAFHLVCLKEKAAGIRLAKKPPHHARITPNPEELKDDRKVALFRIVFKMSLFGGPQRLSFLDASAHATREELATLVESNPIDTVKHVY